MEVGRAEVHDAQTWDRAERLVGRDECACSRLDAVVNPELEDSESARTRARLERAGLIDKPVAARGRLRPDRRRVARARKAAGSGTPLSQLVSDGRG